MGKPNAIGEVTMMRLNAHARFDLIALATLMIVALVGCGSPTPAPAPPTSAPVVQPPPPPVKETVIVKETVPVKETVIVQPTAALTATPTATPTRAPGQVVARTATPAGTLEFTIEFSPSAPRQGDNKVQLTLILHIKGGAKPYKVLEDNLAQKTTATTDGAKYTQDWHNCTPDEPHTVTVVSADGQQSSQSVMMPYRCQ
jgi:hypothetical protein